VLVIDKEPSAGLHASGRNSGVLHAGVYYQAGSLKARLCVSGNQRMRAYCREKNLPINESGKVIVAQTRHDLPALEELHRRAQSNGIEANIIDEHTLQELEPFAQTTEKALFIKDTAVVVPQAVMGALLEDAQKEGVLFAFDCAWERSDKLGLARTTRGSIAYGHLVNCAGLFADRVAHEFGVGRQYRILPFLGRFYQLRPQSRIRVRGNIYPVPDLRNPFLGIHFTRRPNDEVIVGPSALPLLGREQYSGLKGANASDAVTMVKYMVRLLSKNRDHFRSLALKEIGKMPKRGFYREAAGLVRGLQPDDLVAGKSAGIRAQLVNTHTAELLNDFVVEPGPRSTHVLNAVSPAFTSALPFAEHVVGTMTLER
jgi:L-2-hydroxyglutarate oxidase LhgO